MYGDVVGNDSEDEEFLDRAEEFEKAYNFRFEVSPSLLVAGCMTLGTGLPLQLQSQSTSGGLSATAGTLTSSCPGIRRSSTSTPSAFAPGQHQAQAACVPSGSTGGQPVPAWGLAVLGLVRAALAKRVTASRTEQLQAH